MKKFSRTASPIKIGWIAFILIFAFLASSAKADQISEDQVWDFINEVEKASLRRDLQALSNLLGDRVTFDLNLRSKDGVEEITMNRAEYLSSLRQAWEMQGDGYEYERQKTEFVIEGARAQIVAVTREAYPQAGQVVSERGLSISNLALEKGELVLVHFEARPFDPDAPFPQPSIELQ